jgi:hypothetical protein
MPFINSVRGSFGAQGKSKHKLGRVGTASTGGIITISGGYRIHTFSSIGSSTFTPDGEGPVEVTLLGAGGGGSSGNGEWANGGGGGGYLVANFYADKPITVNIGAGGTQQTACNNAYWAINGKGGNSSFSTLIAGGGYGGATVQSGRGPNSCEGGTNTTTGAISVLKNYAGQSVLNGGGENTGIGGHNGLRNIEGLTTYGEGAIGQPNYTPGVHATGYGNGGGGGASCQNGHRGGGYGSQGLVIVRYSLA